MAVTVKLKVPVTVGVPLKLPELLKVKPVGKLPALTLNVGDVKPLCVILREYDKFSTALAKLEGVMVTVGQVLVTTIILEIAEVQVPEIAITAYEAGLPTVIDWVVAPVLHKYADAALEVSVTLCPGVSWVLPEAVMTGALGVVPRLTTVAADTAEVQTSEIVCTV